MIKPDHREGFITPSWPAPENVMSFVTTRLSPNKACIDNSKNVNHPDSFSSFNLATHVNDELSKVLENRQILAQNLGLTTNKFCWLEQVHGTTIIQANKTVAPQKADGSQTQEKNITCIVMTADCLPVLLCDKNGTQVAAVHAGWKGLANGIIEKAVKQFSHPEQVIAWLGPAISQEHFEVGDDVYQAFTSTEPQSASAFIRGKNEGKWMADLYQLARIQLKAAGVKDVYGGDFCSYSDDQHFYSYRRDGQESGRMASMIYLT